MSSTKSFKLESQEFKNLVTTLLTMYLLLTMDLINGVDASQKLFVPNGRYGRRSDPLLRSNSLEKQKQFPINSDSGSSNLFEELNHQDNPTVNWSMDDFKPFWCVLVDEKTSLYRCLDRFSTRSLSSAKEENGKKERINNLIGSLVDASLR